MRLTDEEIAELERIANGRPARIDAVLSLCAEVRDLRAELQVAQMQRDNNARAAREAEERADRAEAVVQAAREADVAADLREALARYDGGKQ